MVDIPVIVVINRDRHTAIVCYGGDVEDCLTLQLVHGVKSVKRCFMNTTGFDLDMSAEPYKEEGIRSFYFGVVKLGGADDDGS